MDLDQSIADRQQVVADNDAAKVDHDQRELDDRRSLTDASADPSGFVQSMRDTLRQGELDEQHALGDARQDQLDRSQSAGDGRQDLLDRQQHAVEHPVASRLPTSAQIQTQDSTRRDAALERAVNARRRAEEALRRARAAEARAAAIKDRGDPHPGHDGSRSPSDDS